MTQRILITEDDRVQRDTIADILLKAGHAVSTAASAREALEALDTDPYDLLITDLRMPEMDGLELLREARRRRNGLDVILMTAHASIKTAIISRASGWTGGGDISRYCSGVMISGARLDARYL